MPPPAILLPAPPLPGSGEPWALFLDVDGTLLDFVEDPLAVEVSSALLAVLHALHHALGGALALVSGRELSQLDRLFDVPSWPAAGLHGLQLRHADGVLHEISPTAAQRAQMRQQVHALALRFDGVQLEDKHSALALHCRQKPEQLAPLHQAASALLPQLHGYELQAGRQVLEFKPAGMNKGQAVLELLGRSPFAGRRPVYLGDDLTDEHGFASAQQHGGMGIRVGARQPTVAHYTLPGPAATEAWLHRVLYALT